MLAHRDAVSERVPAPHCARVTAIFRHHELHMEAALRWLSELLEAPPWS